jgi:hypothetical protein
LWVEREMELRREAGGGDGGRDDEVRSDVGKVCRCIEGAGRG